MPYIITGALGKTFIFGGVSSMFGLATMFGPKSNSIRLLEDWLCQQTFNYLDPSVWYSDCLESIFLPASDVYHTNPRSGYILCYVKFGVFSNSHGLQIPWTTPPVIDGFFAGRLGFSIVGTHMVLASIAMWYPFFKLGDKKALEEEMGAVTKTERPAATK